MSARREQGVVLILVLVIIVLTVSSVYAFARTSLLEVMGARQHNERVRAQALARSGFTLARQALFDDAEVDPARLEGQLETPLDAWALAAREPIALPGGGEIRLRIQDSGSRINLNGLLGEGGDAHSESLAFLRAALERIIEDMPGRQEEKLYDPEALAEAILDWLDQDDRSRLGDEESRQYARPGVDATPLDRPIFSLAELASVPGVDARLLAGLEPYFSTQPLFVPLERAGINPNTAPPHVLGLIFHGGPAEEKRLLAEQPDEIARLLRLRAEGAIFCEEQHTDCTRFAQEITPLGEGVFPPLQYSGDVFRVESEGRHGDARARIVAVIDRGDPKGPQTLYYRMD